ncbi:MAG: hypothetical protein K2L98_04790 [Bacilli bacterium]|nr:hypothetical protein [Bacilli bacterium]
MDKDILLNVAKSQLSARIGIEEGINQTYISAIESSNIDVTVVDKCHKAFGNEITYPVLGFVKYFFGLMEIKNNDLISELKQEINMMADTVVSQGEEVDVEQLGVLLQKMAQDIVERAGDRKVYGNMDNFISVNVQHLVYAVDRIKKSTFSVDDAGIREVLANIKRITQNYLDILLDGNKAMVEKVVNNYVIELLTIMKPELTTKVQEGTTEQSASLVQNAELSASEVFAASEEIPQPSHPGM